MLKFKENQAGFTLIELLIVVIIVAVLAAVGVPLLSGNVDRARLSEADAGLGTVRTAMRTILAENGAAIGYSTIAPTLKDAGVAGSGLGINAGDLTGRYFEDDDYQIVSVNVAGAAPTFCIQVTGDAAAGKTKDATGTFLTAIRGDQVAGVTHSMDQDGSIFANATCTAPRIN